MSQLLQDLAQFFPVGYFDALIGRLDDLFVF